MKKLLFLAISFSAGAQTLGDLNIKLKDSIQNLQTQFDIINKVAEDNKIILQALKDCTCGEMILTEIQNHHILAGIVTIDPTVPDFMGQIVTVLPTPLIIKDKVLYDGFGQSSLKQFPLVSPLSTP